MDEPSVESAQLLGRIYFIAVIPFFGGAVAPWIIGPSGGAEVPIFLLWSFTVLIFCAAGWLGFSVGARVKYAPLHTFVGLVVCGCAVGAFLAVQTHKTFLAASVLTVLHWLHLWWLQKTGGLDKDALKQHRRFVWTVLACHMMVLLNMIYAVKTA
ncbi:MAG: hypothetical protein NVV73_05715 [Cellvibrionaceae bacterium]|nr:hypothetical protein [Cellvibrionaceae bacterium]